MGGLLIGRDDVGVGPTAWYLGGRGERRRQLHGACEDPCTVPGDRELQLWLREQDPAYSDALLEVCRQCGLEPDLADATPELSGARSFRPRRGETFSLVPSDYALDAPASLSSAPLDPPATVPLELLARAPISFAVRRLAEEIRRLRAMQSRGSGE